jgi:UDPglucose 6-dehydrogenase
MTVLRCFNDRLFFVARSPREVRCRNLRHATDTLSLQSPGISIDARWRTAMKITIIGSGYVGLVTGACFAEMGNHVVCVDRDEGKVAQLNAGIVPIHEPGLDAMLHRNHAAGRLRFTSDEALAVTHGRLVFLAVGTPQGEDGSADLSHALAAARSIGRHLRANTVVVNKSTVPVGTADRVKAAIDSELQARGVCHRVMMVSNPEFLKEGSAVDDFMRPDRVVVGSDDAEALRLMRVLYAPYLRNHDRLLTMDLRSAELTKYAANAMLATRISFMNELAKLAEVLHADIEAVRLGIGADARIGYSFLYAGAGYGGSCLPKDVKALIHTAHDHQQSLSILSAVDHVNEQQKGLLASRVQAQFGPSLKGLRFALWGLAFKPETDDVREAPGLALALQLRALGAEVVAYDPVATSAARQALGREAGVRFASSALDACTDADALLIVTEWKEFRSPDFEALRKRLRTPIVFDGRNLYDPAHAAAEGIDYRPIGRPRRAPATTEVTTRERDVAPV